MPASSVPTRVLLVEPDSLQRDLIALVVQRGGFDCDCVKSIDEARAYFADHQADLLLLSLSMQGGKGLELVTALKSSKRYSTLKIVVYSYLGYPEVVRRSIEAGACDFLVKPLDTDLLIERLRRAVGETSRQ